MKKLLLLRDYLLKEKALALSPEQLHVSCRKGAFYSTPGNPNMHINGTAEVLITDYRGDFAALCYLLKHWLDRYQPERADSIEFNADIIDSKTVDVALYLPLTHDILPIAETEGTRLHYRDELPPCEAHIGDVEVFIKTELIGSWSPISTAPSLGDDPKILPSPGE